MQHLEIDLGQRGISILQRTETRSRCFNKLPFDNLFSLFKLGLIIVCVNDSVLKFDYEFQASELRV